MTTLHVENTVREYDAWKAVFDKFERFRADHGVRSYRVSRGADEPNRVAVDLDFDTLAEAMTFRTALERIWKTPQSREQVLGEHRAVLLDVVDSGALSAAAASTA